MEFLKKIWKWLDGNKTLIAALIGLLLSNGVIPEGLLSELLMWLATLLGGVGVIHKVQKAVKEK